jgi:hypothetical protein
VEVRFETHQAVSQHRREQAALLPEDQTVRHQVLGHHGGRLLEDLALVLVEKTPGRLLALLGLVSILFIRGMSCQRTLEQNLTTLHAEQAFVFISPFCPPPRAWSVFLRQLWQNDWLPASMAAIVG